VGFEEPGFREISRRTFGRYGRSARTGGSAAGTRYYIPLGWGLITQPAMGRRAAEDSADVVVGEDVCRRRNGGEEEVVSRRIGGPV
jgi:hypothetical protein